MINSCLHENFSGGIGDFLRGSVFLCEQSFLNNRGYSISFNKHAIGKYIISPNNITDDNIIDLETYEYKSFKREWHEQLLEKIEYILNNHDTINISSYYHPILHHHPKKLIEQLNSHKPNPQHIHYLCNSIDFCQEIKDYVLSFLENLGIKENFDVMHFRLGDMDSWGDLFSGLAIPKKHKNNINFQSFNFSFDKCLEIIKRFKNKPTVIISDNNKFKQWIRDLKRDDLIVLHDNSIHTSKKPGLFIYEDKELHRNDDYLFYVAADMYLLTLANKNYGFSVYDWGSGFVYWLSRIYQKPVSLYKIQDIFTTPTIWVNGLD